MREHYLLYFLQDAVHYQQAAQGVTAFQIILTGTLLIASVVSGLLSDRLQRRKVFVMGASLVIALSFLSCAGGHFLIREMGWADTSRGSLPFHG